MKKKDFRKDDVTAGREFVEAYVPFVHYVELFTTPLQKEEATVIPKKLKREVSTSIKWPFEVMI